MRLVIDTNVLLQCIARDNIYRPIWDAYLQGKFQLVISVDVLFEYIELLQQRTSVLVAKNISETIRTSRSTLIIRRWIRWRMITSDPDDNKFFDIAVASNSEYLVTNDTHFDVVKAIEFPKMNVVSARDFLEIIKSL